MSDTDVQQLFLTIARSINLEQKLGRYKTEGDRHVMGVYMMWTFTMQNETLRKLRLDPKVDLLGAIDSAVKSILTDTTSEYEKMKVEEKEHKKMVGNLPTHDHELKKMDTNDTAEEAVPVGTLLHLRIRTLSLEDQMKAVGPFETEEQKKKTEEYLKRFILCENKTLTHDPKTHTSGAGSSTTRAPYHTDENREKQEKMDINYLVEDGAPLEPALLHTNMKKLSLEEQLVFLGVFETEQKGMDADLESIYNSGNDQPGQPTGVAQCHEGDGTGPTSNIAQGSSSFVTQTRATEQQKL